MMGKSFFVFLICLFYSIGFAPKILAQESYNLLSCAEPFETELLKKKAKRQEKGAISADSIAPKGITVPSLWWAKEQFDPFAGKLIINWLAYPKQQRIDLLVNWQLWTLLDYLKRYRFINNFGTLARDYGYNLRIFNQQNECLAIYRYNPNLIPPQWEIQVDSSSLKESLEVDKNEQEQKQKNER